GATEAAHHHQNGCSEVGGHPGVEGQLGGTGHVGVVGPDDHHRLTTPLHGSVAVDDGGEGGLRVRVHVVVGDAYAVVVAEVDAVVIQQEAQDVVVTISRPGYRSEDTRGLDVAGERVEHAERNERLAGMALEGRDVD